MGDVPRNPVTPPCIYILHGEDEFAITHYVVKLQSRVDSADMVEINTTRLDGRTISLDDLETALFTLPFMAPMRLVILTNPLTRLNNPDTRKRFIALIEKAPASVILVVVETRLLTEERDRRRGQVHWLEKWALSAGGKVHLQAFNLPLGAAMAQRIQELSRDLGGKITPRAAELLGSLVGDSPRTAYQELQKLLAYVRYERPIEVEDVELLTADQGHGDIFKMVDAIGDRDGKRAANMLQRLLAEQEPLPIFGMVVRQFRLLILAREAIDNGQGDKDFARQARQHPYVAEKVYKQARRFSLPQLEVIYHRLLDLDEGMKTGETDGDLALETFVATVTY